MRTLRDDSGVSLTELLVVTVLMGVILATAYMLIDSATVMADQSEARSIAADDAQRAIESMSREIKQAQEAREGKGALISALPDSIEFYMDVNRDGPPEKVRYYRTGTTLFRQVAPVTVSTPLAHGAYGAGVPLLEDIAPTQGPMFCYHSTELDNAVVCANGQQHKYKVVSTTDPQNTVPVVALVGIDLRNRHASGRQDVTVTTSVVVRIRAVENIVK